MSILITGGSGFIGRALTERLLRRGYRIYSLSRHPPESAKRLIPLEGDITKPNLGLDEVPKDITIVYHLASIHTLRQEDEDGSIWRTNVAGTNNVLEFCLKHNVPRLFFTSTAYTWEVNPYGRSKIRNEEDILAFSKEHGLKVTIFKPSVVLGTPENPYLGHFSRFVSAVIQIHRRAELIRRKIEGTLHLPVIEPLLRIRGNPDGNINLVSIDAVTQGLAKLKKEGIVWLTNPNPPTIGQVLEWAGEFIMVRIKIMPEFKPTPIEAAFAKIASAFLPYAYGDDFPSNLKNCSRITRESIHDTIKGTLLTWLMLLKEGFYEREN